MKQIKISAYKPWVTKEGVQRPGGKPYDADFYTEMENIRNGTYRQIIEDCRLIKDSKARQDFKVRNLPSLTLSVVCKDWRKTENIIAYTDILNIDIDGKLNPHIKNWGEVRDLIFQLPTVIFAFITAGGEGVTFGVRYNHERHYDTFFSIGFELKKHLGIEIDKGVHDYVRLRFVSYDPECKIRYNIDELPIVVPSPEYLASKKDYHKPSYLIEPVGNADNEHNFLEAVKKAESQYKFEEGSRHFFLVSVAGSCNIMGMSRSYLESMILSHFTGEKLLLPVEYVYKSYASQHGTFNIEAKNDKLNRRITDVLVRNYLHEGVKPSDEDLFEVAKNNDANLERVDNLWRSIFAEYEHEFGYNKFHQINKVEIWLSKRWDFYFNVVTQQPEQTAPGMEGRQAVNPDEIYRQLQKAGFKFPHNNIKSLLKSNFMQPYDPIENYFKSLSYHNGGQSEIDRLSSYVTTTMPEYWQGQFKKILVRHIPCGLGKTENRIVPVLQGVEENGKTTFIRNLSPWGQDHYYTESPVLGSGKDTEFKFADNFIYNLEELAALNSYDLEKLKAIISKRSIKERRPHATFEVELPRRCNFWGSTNKDFFLQSDGNTRWLVFKVLDIDWGYAKDIDINKVWAEAWYLYNSGFDYQLTKEEKEIRNAVNAGLEISCPEEELLLLHYKPSEQGNFYTTSEIAAWLSERYKLKFTPQKVGKSIKKIFGIDRKNKKIDGIPISGYFFDLCQQVLTIEGDEGKTQEKIPKAPALPYADKEDPF